MIIKKIFLISAFSLSFLSGVHATEYWLRQQSPTTKWLLRCSFPDTLNGWAVSDSGVIIHTSNGSTSWSVQNSGVFTLIWSVNFVNIRLGWAVTDKESPSQGSRILRTTNGGNV